MKKNIGAFFIFAFLFTCSKYPLLSELYNTRMQLVLKGTYESNDPYNWNTNIYLDDNLGSYSPSAISSLVAMSDVSLYIDIADVRLAVGSGKPTNTTPAEYYTTITKDRHVLCSSNTTPWKYSMLTCADQNGDQGYADFFSTGFTFPSASDVPVIPLDSKGNQRIGLDGKPATAYNELDIFFRKLTMSPAILYDTANPGGVAQTTQFDNRVVNGINLMDSGIVQFNQSDDPKTATPLMFPLNRTDLSLKIPDGNDAYVLEVRIFLKNLLMKHVLVNGSSYTTFVGPSDWKANHNGSSQMGGNLVFTARIYDPANVGSITINDAEALNTAFKSYYAAVPAGSSFNGSDIPLTASSRIVSGTGTTGTIKNLPPGDYDIYKTCDNTLLTPSGASAAGNYDGFPETAKSCTTKTTVTAGNTTTIASGSISCVCP
ncbi:MAG: hypothetical protein OEV66_09045 [Spirochaetia bacterium]|nr:hypothetical protein [Spirochaetia bacterium]